MTTYHSHGVKLSIGQKDKLAKALKNNSAITIRLSNSELTGQVIGEDFKTEYINFHANLFKIYKKTVYNRKYHLSHQIILKNKVEISCSTNIVEINKILPQINGKRKRIISLKYLLHRILQLMKIDSSQIELTKSKKTMKLYNVYWDKIMDIIGPQIMHIINQT